MNSILLPTPASRAREAKYPGRLRASELQTETPAPPRSVALTALSASWARRREGVHGPHAVATKERRAEGAVARRADASAESARQGTTAARKWTAEGTKAGRTGFKRSGAASRARAGIPLQRVLVQGVLGGTFPPEAERSEASWNLRFEKNEVLPINEKPLESIYADFLRIFPGIV